MHTYWMKPKWQQSGDMYIWVLILLSPFQTRNKKKKTDPKKRKQISRYLFMPQSRLEEILHMEFSISEDIPWDQKKIPCSFQLLGSLQSPGPGMMRHHFSLLIASPHQSEQFPRNYFQKQNQSKTCPYWHQFLLFVARIFPPFHNRGGKILHKILLFSTLL